MATFCVGVLRAQTIFCVADEGGWCRGWHERFARERVDPVGCAGTGGKIVSDGLRIRGIFSHLPVAKEKEEGDGWPRPL
jgi:hypothetical protein